MLIIDRLEGCYAVCENDAAEQILLEKHLLPAETKEGDILTMDESGIYRIDKEATEQRRAKLQRLQERLFRRTI